MEEQEAQIFALTLAALTATDGGAESGMIESAEPTTATCTVERSDERSIESVESKTDAKVERS